MRILTVDNEHYSMNNISDSIDEDVRYSVLDYSDPQNVDYIFVPLIFLESFNKSVVDLKIGPYSIQMPSDWGIVIGDKNSGEIEILPLKQINDRPFQAFSLNPITGYIPEFLDIEIMNVFPDVKWYFPKLKFGHILTMPLEQKQNQNVSFLLRT